MQPHLRRDALALRDAGFAVDVICDSEPGLPHFEKRDGLTVIRLPIRHKRGGMGRYLLEYVGMPVLAAGALALRSVGRRYDYVEIDTMPTWLIAAAVVPKLRGAKVVLYMFEHMAELLASDKNLSERHPVVRMLESVEMACVRAADRVLTPAERNRERFIQKGIASDKVLFIPNGPDEQVFLADIDQPLTARSRRDDGTFRLVTHGSLLERYGIDDLIEAVARLRDRIPGLRLDVIGNGEYECELRDLTSRLGLDDLITFAGPVPFDRMASRLIQADLAVAPYRLDLLANKVMEYLLLGIPAVVADWPTMRRYFCDDAICYVEPGNVEALASAIETMYRDPSKREKQAAVARERYLDSIAWRKAKETYLAVYGRGSDEARVGGEAASHRRSGGWLSFVFGQSRGPRNAFARLPTILGRFGVSTGKSERHLHTLLNVTERFSVRPTLPVTAVTARRNPDVLHELRDRGVELAAHGLVHNDYASLPREQQFRQVAQARDELAAVGIPVDGWRCPYSRWNQDTIDALKASEFAYDATPVYAWPAFEREGIEMTSEAVADYERLCRLFGVRDAGRMAVLPATTDGLLRIPMSIPQDEDMVDRLHLGSEEMSRVWLNVLNHSHDLGETFVICLHPERAALCADPLDATLSHARSLGDVWLAPLGEIADWWNERSRASVDVGVDGREGRWRVTVNASERVAVRCGQHRFAGTGTHEIDMPRKPVIHCGSDWTEDICNRVREAGYLIERSEVDRAGCAFNLSDLAVPTADPDEIVRHLNARSEELTRIEPWPVGYKSCMSVTGDIDALTLFDFAMRLKEFS